MRIPKRMLPCEFLPRFFDLLFGPDDRVVICTLYPRWTNESCTRSEAVERALSLCESGTPNVYFRASAHDGSDKYGKVNCVRIGALFLDVDYGVAGYGHKKDSLFKTADDALGYILTMPLRPSILWHTGHGFQACYLLDQPYVFGEPDGDGADRQTRFDKVSRRLSLMALADSTHTPEHAFRIPLTLNSKRHDYPDLPDEQGAVLWCDEQQRYTFEEIEVACSAYGAEEYMVDGGNDDAKNADDNVDAEDDDGDVDDGDKTLKPWEKVSDGVDCPYEELPEGIREDIEKSHGDYSTAMYGIVGRMVRAGYSDACIRKALHHGHFPAHYKAKLKGHYEAKFNDHINMCLTKLSGVQERSVYPTSMAPSIRIVNECEEVPLSECAPLPAALDAMLTRYAQAKDTNLANRVRYAARFHEHLFNSHRSGVLESPCGSGKSTWAFAHIAVNARPDQRYAYVTETIDALYRAAETLEQLTDQPVGRVHGFNDKKCLALCGREHKWWQCGNRRESVCHRCSARTSCYFYQREAERKKPILCMTHSGLASALEHDYAGLIKDLSVIVDEQLSPLNSATFTKDKLDNLQSSAGNVQLSLGRIFQGGRLSHASELAAYRVPESADTFARRNYVFRDEQQAKVMAEVYEDLRTCSALGLELANPFRPGDLDQARETLGRLLNVFRPSSQNNVTYAYRESYDDQGQISYDIVRNRFRFGSEGSYRKLWVLNASARLSVDAYPEDMTVYTCPDLPDASNLLTIHVVRNNPTKTKQDESVRVSEVLLRLAPSLREHKQILVATDKDESAKPEIERQLKALHGEDLQVVWLTRGRIKGSNDAGACTLAYLTGMATFTTLSDCALRASLSICRTFPDCPYVLNEQGFPNWRGGMPVFAVLRTIYALRALDELYQAIWRTAVRNDLPAHAVIAVPQPDWLVALWKTVAPRFMMGQALKQKTETVARPKWDEESGQVCMESVAFDYVQDDQMAGLCIINVPPGTKMKKLQAANEFGYKGKRGWERHETRLSQWLSPFFTKNHHTLTRKSYHGIRLLTDSTDDLKAMLTVINDATQAYKGDIPAKSRSKSSVSVALKKEVEIGIEFWGIEHEGELAGVMGLQYLQDVTLIKHLYVRASLRRIGLGGRLLDYVRTVIRPPFIGVTWASTSVAVSFYEKHGFRPVSPSERDSLLSEFEGISQQQVEAAVVLADEAWFERQR